MKTCIRCKIQKPVDDFHNDRSSKDGKWKYCKPCSKNMADASKAKNPSKYRETDVKWYHNHLEYQRKANREDYARRRSVFLQKQKLHHRTKVGNITDLYSAIKKRLKTQKTYKTRKLLFTFEEFKQFIITSDYGNVYTAWVESGYQSNLAPSVDRVDNNSDYSLDNIQIITRNQNIKKRWEVDYAKAPQMS